VSRKSPPKPKPAPVTPHQTPESPVSRLIREIPELIKEYLRHHLLATVIVLAGIVVLMWLRKPSECLQLETEVLGRISVGCGASEKTAAGGTERNTYTDSRAGFALRLEDKDHWSIVQAEAVQADGRPSQSFRFPAGLLSEQSVTIQTSDGVVAFLASQSPKEGKASFWVFRAAGQTETASAFVSEENRRLLRTGTVAAVAVFGHPQESRPLPDPAAGGSRHVQMSKLEVAPDHKTALLQWKAPYSGLNADIVARVIVGARDTFYVVALRVKPSTEGENKLNEELRSMLESFHLVEER
jgi:hypothetical protein